MYESHQEAFKSLAVALDNAKIDWSSDNSMCFYFYGCGNKLVTVDSSEYFQHFYSMGYYGDEDQTELVKMRGSSEVDDIVRWLKE